MTQMDNATVTAFAGFEDDFKAAETKSGAVYPCLNKPNAAFVTAIEIKEENFKFTGKDEKQYDEPGRKIIFHMLSPENDISEDPLEWRCPAIRLPDNKAALLPKDQWIVEAGLSDLKTYLLHVLDAEPVSILASLEEADKAIAAGHDAESDVMLPCVEIVVKPNRKNPDYKNVYFNRHLNDPSEVAASQ